MISKMELPDRRKGGRPRRRFVYLVKEYMQRIGLTEEDDRDIVSIDTQLWRPLKEAAKRKVKAKIHGKIRKYKTVITFISAYMTILGIILIFHNWKTKLKIKWKLK